MPKLISKILEQRMDRREFLVRVGMSVLGIVGVMNALKTLGGDDRSPHTPGATDKSGGGYGASAYGGDSGGRSNQVAAPKPHQFG